MEWWRQKQHYLGTAKAVNHRNSLTVYHSNSHLIPGLATDPKRNSSQPGRPGALPDCQYVLLI